MTATSTALSQFDIILDIVRHLTPPRVYDIDDGWDTKFWFPNFHEQDWYKETDAKARRVALARLARTCRAFSEHALDVLWAAPPGGLYTVLSLFSAFGYTEQTGATPTCTGRYTWQYRSYNLDGAIPPDEWATFARYAARIRAIGYHTFKGPKCRATLCDTVFNVLSNINGEGPLFHNLRYLAWQRGSPCNEADPTGTRILRMLTSPSLSALALWHPKRSHERSFPARRGSGKSEVEAFVVYCPNLQHVVVDVNLQRDSSDLFPLTKLGRLETLVLDSVDLDLLQHIGRLEDLRTLKCSLQTTEARDTETRASTPPLPAGSLFPSLTHVVLRYPRRVPLAVDMLSSISSHTLSCVDIRFNFWFHCSLSVFFSVLCSSQNILSLTTVKVHIPIPNVGSQLLPPQLRFVTMAEPLLHLRRLEVLQFELRYRVLNIFDDDLTQMARAWPHIVALNITYDDGRQAVQANEGHPTLRALVGLARECRALESLKLDVQDVLEQELHALEEEAIACAEPQTNLVNLELVRGGDATCLLLPNVTRLVRALHAFFPHLEACGRLRADETQEEDT